MNDYLREKQLKQPLLTAPIGALVALRQRGTTERRKGHGTMTTGDTGQKNNTAASSSDVSAQAQNTNLQQELAALERENRQMHDELVSAKARLASRTIDLEGIREQQERLEAEMDTRGAVIARLTDQLPHQTEGLDECVRQGAEATTRTIAAVSNALNRAAQTIAEVTSESTASVKETGQRAAQEIAATFQDCDAKIEEMRVRVSEMSDAAIAALKKTIDELTVEEQALMEQRNAKRANVKNLKSEIIAIDAEAFAFINKDQLATKKSWIKKVWGITKWPLIILMLLTVPTATVFYYKDSATKTESGAANDQPDEQTAYRRPRTVASASAAATKAEPGTLEGLTHMEMNATDMAKMRPIPDGKGGKIHSLLNRKRETNTFNLFTCPVQGKEANRFYCDKHEIVLECTN